MLKGKVGIVTGGSGAIGGAVCKTLARYGMDVAFTWNSREEESSKLASELEAMGRRALARRVEGCDNETIEAFCKEVEKTFGPIDLLVNNIGVTQVMPFALIEEEDWDEVMNVNLKSMFLFSKAVARGMIRERKGVILNLGSIAGHRLLEVPVHYAAAKAGVSGFTIALAKELCRYGIRVNEVCPGLIDGGIGKNLSERQLEQVIEYCSQSRPGEPEEVAELVAFLASDRASYINAQRLTIDGGL